MSIHKEIVDFLIPHMIDQNERQAHISITFSGNKEIISSIEFTGSAHIFTERLVSNLEKYGETNEGILALSQILQTVSQQLGKDKQKKAQELISELQQPASMKQLSFPDNPPPTSTKPNGNSDEQNKIIKWFIRALGVIGTAIIGLYLEAYFLSPPYAQFEVNPASGEAPLVVNIDNNSENVYLFKWDFDDGTTSNEQNVITHTYSTSGIYTIHLLVSNRFWMRDQATVEIVVNEPQASQTSLPTIVASATPSSTIVGVSVTSTETSQPSPTPTEMSATNMDISPPDYEWIIFYRETALFMYVDPQEGILDFTALEFTDFNEAQLPLQFGELFNDGEAIVSQARCFTIFLEGQSPGTNPIDACDDLASDRYFNESVTEDEVVWLDSFGQLRGQIKVHLSIEQTCPSAMLCSIVNVVPPSYNP